jgi:GMP synthase-like glutamine amidotransferase
MIVRTISVAILDLYNGVANEGINGFKTILNHYREQHKLDLEYRVFDVRQKEEMPGLDFDIYFFSGGPGSPLSEAENWDIRLFGLIDQLTQHNLSDSPDKKYGFFVCHSFQLMCRHYKLGEVNMRKSPSFGVLPVHLTEAGREDAVNKNLGALFYAIDSRSWQVINPDEERFKELDFEILAIEKERPYVDLPRALMTIRFSPYFVATQFHPEVDPAGMKAFLLQNAKSDEVIKQVGDEKYRQILTLLEDPKAIAHTQQTLIPNFLDQAVAGL